MSTSATGIFASEKKRHTAVNGVQPPSQKILTTVTLICTLYNEEQTVVEFLDSAFQMSCLPGEFIIVDGGSTDQTTKLISEYLNTVKSPPNFRLIVDPSCNKNVTPGPIGKGRNVAISNARNDIIACTDCGCVLDKFWLEHLTAPLLENLDTMVVAGWYLPDARSFFERCIGTVFLLPPDAVNPNSVTPSSRSIAFRKSVWEKVNGYPEVYYTAEDTWYVAKIRESGLNIVFAPNAIVYWRMKSSLRSFATLIYSYGFGDGFCSLSPTNILKNVIKLGFVLLFAIASVWVSTWFFLVLIVYLWFLPFNRRMKEALRRRNIFSMPLLALIKITADASYLIGRLRGRWASSQKAVKSSDKNNTTQ
jgi:glycosyltransferase involved in cell wall biosynthesis